MTTPGQNIGKLTTSGFLDEIHHLLWIKAGDNGGTWDEGWNCRDDALLSGIVCQLKFIGPESGKGVYLLATGDSYDASRILIKDAVRRFQVKGDHIAMIPNRENLIVVGSEDVQGLAGMVKLANKALKDPRPISGIALAP